ncbi:hypothetical protein RZS08_56030, partial [Arthrospira platensis SPKY1]|nr:hypothetical protein [Arthrospira platensis SPKY1]
TQDTHLEFEPAFSPDGRYLAYVTWDDEAMGAIRKLDLQTGLSTVLTAEKGIYRTPAFSPDGQKIVFQKEGGNLHQGFAYCQNPGIYTMPAGGGEANLVCEEG